VHILSRSCTPRTCRSTTLSRGALHAQKGSIHARMRMGHALSDQACQVAVGWPGLAPHLIPSSLQAALRRPAMGVEPGVEGPRHWVPRWPSPIHPSTRAPPLKMPRCKADRDRDHTTSTPTPCFPHGSGLGPRSRPLYRLWWMLSPSCPLRPGTDRSGSAGVDRGTLPC
jgi:hypothetical protein